MTTLAEAYDEFTLANLANGLAPATIRWYLWTLEPMLDFLGADRALQLVTRADIRRYVAMIRTRDSRFTGHHNRPEISGGLSSASIAAYIVAALRFWSWASAEYRLDNPAEGIKKPQLRNKAPKAIAPHDFVRLFHAAESPRDRLLLAFLADTGCRRGSLPNIRIKDLDMQRRCCYVREKTGRSRWLYWTPLVSALIHAWLDRHPSPDGWLFCAMGDGRVGHQMTSSGIYQILRRLKKLAGVRGNANPHAFRHNFARMYLQTGGDAITLAKLMGHRDPRTTAEHYAIFSGGELSTIHNEHSPLTHILELEGISKTVTMGNY